MKSKRPRKYKSKKKFLPLTYVITHPFNGDFTFLIQRIVSLKLVCISNVSY